MERYDAIIVGGGPAGSSMAARLASSGRNVAVLERKAFPRDKLCGEFLSPESLELLDDLSALDEIKNAGAAQIRFARFISADGSLIEFPLPGPALGISREKLDSILWKRAAAGGAHCISEATVLSIQYPKIQVESKSSNFDLESPLIIGAYGKRNTLDRGRSFLKKASPYIGLKRHYRISETPDGRRTKEELSGYVEIHMISGGYCGISFIEEDRINVSMLLTRKSFDELNATKWDVLIKAIGAKNFHLGSRFQGMQPLPEKMQTESEIPFDSKEVHHEGVLYIGDAAGMMAPLCGDGISIALRSSALLWECISSSSDPASLCKAWKHVWQVDFNRRIRIGNSMQALLLMPIIGPLMFGIAENVPGIAQLLMKATRKIVALSNREGRWEMAEAPAEKRGVEHLWPDVEGHDSYALSCRLQPSGQSCADARDIGKENFHALKP